jgi:hypothetical protein
VDDVVSASAPAASGGSAVDLINHRSSQHHHISYDFNKQPPLNYISLSIFYPIQGQTNEHAMLRLSSYRYFYDY